MDDLRTEVIRTASGLAALEPEWQRLLETRARWLPFETPQWHQAWWATLPETKATVADELYSVAVRTSAGALVGVAPMMLTRRPGVGPAALRAIDFIGPDPNLTELRGIISHPEHELDVFHAVRRALHERRDEWHWIHWRGLKVGHEAEHTLAGLSTTSHFAELENYLVPLPATWEELKSSRPRNLKESLRKCYNSLKRDGHEFTFEVATAPGAVSSALDRFFELHRARSLVDGTVTHRDVFAASSSQTFVREVCRRLAERGATRVFELRIGAAVVASRIGFVQGDSLYLYYSGYEPKWSDYSVMTTTVAEAMKYAISQGLRQANLSFGTDVSKTRWAPERVVYRDAVERSPSLARRYAHPAYLELRRLIEEKGVKKMLGRVLNRRS